MKKLFDTLSDFVTSSDMFLLGVCFISSVFGIILISSVTRVQGGNNITVQIIALVIGIVLYFLLSLIDIDIISDKSVILFIVSALFISTLFIWGESGGSGNRAWLRFGGIGIQPVEIVKISFVIILAKMLADGRDKRNLNSPLTILKMLAMFASLFVLILISSADLGSALVYFFILLSMFFIGGISLWYFAAGAAVIAAFMPVIWQNFLSSNQRDRIRAPYDPSVDPTGLVLTWQVRQSKLAIAGGGFTGQGIFNGKITQAGIIPRQNTDFIFAAAGEEFGFVGCVAVVALLVIIITRCVYVGVKSNDTMGLLVCTGIASMLIFQTLENIGMCLGLTPVIGLTLPFFSYGGSSVITSYAAMGIVSGIKMRSKPLRFRNY